MNRKKVALALVLISVSFGSGFFVTGVLRAEVPSVARDPVRLFSYAAKWICNQEGAFFGANAATRLGLVPGEYQTAINIHNPSNSTTLSLEMKFVEIEDWTEIQGNFTHVPRQAIIIQELTPYLGFFEECPVILPHLGLARSIAAKGFLTITTSTPNLDVVAEYTTRIANVTIVGGHEVIDYVGGSVDIERIPARPFVP